MAKTLKTIRLLPVLVLILLGTSCATHYGAMVPRSTQEVRRDRLWEYYEFDHEGFNRDVEMESDVISG